MSSMNESAKVSEIAISVKNVSKYFNPSKGQRSIKNAFTSMFSKNKDKILKNGYWALRDINFEVKKGEFFGIVGRNGSGKSTLLKMIAGVYIPTKGTIHVNGKLVPFIELGVGFNPELSGKDNVYLNGALLGFTRSEMTAMYDDIVSFAELQDHMDVKLKNFSSGMQVRLAFSIAIRADTDILVLDEVLAVGDASFQQKCYEYFATIKQSKKTVVFVTHDMSAVERFCDRVLIIDKGEKSGEIMSVRNAVKTYNRINQEAINSKIDGTKTDSASTRPKHELYIKSVKLLNEEHKETNKFSQGKEMSVAVKVGVYQPDHNDAPIVLGLSFHDTDSVNLAGPNSIGHTFKASDDEIIYKLPKVPFNDGKYYLSVALFDEFVSKQYDIIDREITFTVATETVRHGKLILEDRWEK